MLIFAYERKAAEKDLEYTKILVSAQPVWIGWMGR